MTLTDTLTRSRELLAAATERRTLTPDYGPDCSSPRPNHWLPIGPIADDSDGEAESYLAYAEPSLAPLIAHAVNTHAALCRIAQEALETLEAIEPCGEFPCMCGTCALRDATEALTALEEAGS